MVRRCYLIPLPAPQPAETITTEDRIARLQHKVTRFVGQVIDA